MRSDMPADDSRFILESEAAKRPALELIVETPSVIPRSTTWLSTTTSLLLPRDFLIFSSAVFKVCVRKKYVLIRLRDLRIYSFNDLWLGGFFIILWHLSFAAKVLRDIDALLLEDLGGWSVPEDVFLVPLTPEGCYNGPDLIRVIVSRCKPKKSRRGQKIPNIIRAGPTISAQVQIR